MIMFVFLVSQRKRRIVSQAEAPPSACISISAALPASSSSYDQRNSQCEHSMRGENEQRQQSHYVNTNASETLTAQV